MFCRRCNRGRCILGRFIGGRYIGRRCIGGRCIGEDVLQEDVLGEICWRKMYWRKMYWRSCSVTESQPSHLVKIHSDINKSYLEQRNYHTTIEAVKMSKYTGKTVTATRYKSPYRFIHWPFLNNYADMQDHPYQFSRYDKLSCTNTYRDTGRQPRISITAVESPNPRDIKNKPFST